MTAKKEPELTPVEATAPATQEQAASTMPLPPVMPEPVSAQASEPGPLPLPPDPEASFLGAPLTQGAGDLINTAREAAQPRKGKG